MNICEEPKYSLGSMKGQGPKQKNGRPILAPSPTILTRRPTGQPVIGSSTISLTGIRVCFALFYCRQSNLLLHLTRDLKLGIT